MLKQVARLVAAYVRNNRVPSADIPDIIRSTYASLAGLGQEAPAEPELVPAISVKRSVRPDAVVCLECGLAQKMLKRHLASAHGLSTGEYRERWNLPSDYPMVAPDYAARRSELAKSSGLGRKPKGEAGADSEHKPHHKYPASRWSKKSD